MDTASKITSSIITRRLQRVLTNEGFNFQFGSTPKTGCPDANLTLKSILQLRQELENDLWVVFLDLVKAFNTANHQLLLKLLQIFVIPPRIVRIVEKLYTDFHMQLKIGKETTAIEFLTGMKQGKVLAPTLFLFLMQAMAKNVQDKWHKASIVPFSYLFDG